MEHGGNAQYSSIHWSAHGHINTTVRNQLSPETTETLVYIYSNRKLVWTIENTEELKMFAWGKLSGDV
jgi:hypothetical protein